MTYGSAWWQASEATQASTQVASYIEQLVSQPQAQDHHPACKRPQGRPAKLTLLHLGMGIIQCVLMNWKAQLDLWRLICTGAIPGYGALPMSDQTVYNWLEAHGIAAVQQLSGKLYERLKQQEPQEEAKQLAPFAREILAVDESKLSCVRRWLAEYWHLHPEHPALQLGRLSGLFDIRRQQWVRLDLLPNAATNCKVHVRQLIEPVEAGMLLLFDRGYWSYEWFDELTDKGIFWISRPVSRMSSEVIRWLVQQEGYSEALIFLGGYRADRGRFAVRLIRWRYRGRWYSYVTNVLDPLQLPGWQVVQLYARRWDIELAFQVIKDFLGLRLLWSAKWEVIGAQVLAGVVAAQLVSLLHKEIAARAQVKWEEVSVELLARLAPLWQRQGLDPVQIVVEQGRALGLIRASTRHHRHEHVPRLAAEQIDWPPPGTPFERKPRYGSKQTESNKANKKESTKPEKKQKVKKIAAKKSSGRRRKQDESKRREKQPRKKRSPSSASKQAQRATKEQNAPPVC